MRDSAIVKLMKVQYCVPWKHSNYTLSYLWRALASINRAGLILILIMTDMGLFSEKGPHLCRKSM